MIIRKFFPPISLPILFFAAIICLGSILLHTSFCRTGQDISWIDAFFTATSATCVTGLSVVDTGSFFSTGGQTVIFGLIQLGGLGIMTFASLALYLHRNQVSITDRLAVGQTLLNDTSFHLGRFLIRIVMWTFIFELVGAILLWLLEPGRFTPFSALFHAVSAFCNAGFSLYPDSLVQFQGRWGINVVFMVLIIFGGLGFAVLAEFSAFIPGRRRERYHRGRHRFSWYAQMVVKSSLFLIVVGAIAIFCAESIGNNSSLNGFGSLLTAFFQSVTSRTAGFNTVPIETMTNVSLLFMVILMFIGGAPGSCAGGVKVTTFRTLAAYLISQMKGREQVVVNKIAIAPESVSRALILVIFSATMVFVTTVVLMMTEGGNIPHQEARGLFLEILFETVSAFGTVGLSIGLTAKLSGFGKIIIMILMFVGRLGPLILLAAVQEIGREKLFRRPEEQILIG